jgi:hypothetical protein
MVGVFSYCCFFSSRRLAAGQSFSFLNYFQNDVFGKAGKEESIKEPFAPQYRPVLPFSQVFISSATNAGCVAAIFLFSNGSVS